VKPIHHAESMLFALFKREFLCKHYLTINLWFEALSLISIYKKFSINTQNNSYFHVNYAHYLALKNLNEINSFVVINTISGNVVYGGGDTKKIRGNTWLISSTLL